MNVIFLNAPTLASKIPKLLRSCTQLDICIAFVKIKGLRKVLSDIRVLLSQGGRVRIVFGISRGLGITDPKSVEELIALSVHPEVSIKRFDSPYFHPKLYIFHGDSPSLIVGSSNLTNAALTKNVEANLLVQDVDDRLFADVEAFFNDCYEKAIPLTENDLELFEAETEKKFDFKSDESMDNVPVQINFDDDASFSTIGELLKQKKKERFYLMHLSWGDAGQREEC